MANTAISPANIYHSPLPAEMARFSNGLSAARPRPALALSSPMEAGDAVGSRVPEVVTGNEVVETVGGPKAELAALKLRQVVGRVKVVPAS
jgi:hypothetical protein